MEFKTINDLTEKTGINENLLILLYDNDEPDIKKKNKKGNLLNLLNSFHIEEVFEDLTHIDGVQYEFPNVYHEVVVEKTIRNGITLIRVPRAIISTRGKFFFSDSSSPLNFNPANAIAVTVAFLAGTNNQVIAINSTGIGEVISIKGVRFNFTL